MFEVDLDLQPTNFSLDSEAVSFAYQFWLVLMSHLQTSTPIIQVLSNVDEDISTDKLEDVLAIIENILHAL